ncbi:MAG: tetratricopeptide repeat protein [Myxococcales bacterium]|nr:tetratricopeptide repeat protein [Myxococcales bacterium]
MTRAIVLLALLGLSGCKKDDAPALLEKARTALFEQRPQDALDAYKKALDALERDTSPEAAVYRARALRGASDVYAFQLGDARRAVEVYRELIAVCPEAPETLEGRVHLAELLRHHFRDLRGAIAELTAALARNPPASAELSYQVASMYFELQDYEQCQLEAGKLVQKFETSAFVADALFLRAQALSMMDGRKPEAQRVFAEVIERFPDSKLKPHALFELGRLKADAGEAERAIELWVEALKAHPTPSVVQDSIARVRARLRATTPDKVGDAVSAFDRDTHPFVGHAGAEGEPVPVPRAKTSVEAAGGTAEEAAREATMPAEAGPKPEGPPQGEGSF